MDLFTAIQTRRSIRRFSGAPVPREDLEKIVDAGRLAASGNNLQPWEFIVVTRCEMIEQLKMTHEWIAGAGAVIVVVVDSSSRWWLEDASAAMENMLLAATALGYGTCWMEGFALRNEEHFKELLGVPAALRLLAIIPVGIATETPQKEKRSLENVLHWEQY
jgi:nitroreductase